MMKVEIKSVQKGKGITQVLYVDGDAKVRSDCYITLTEIKQELEKKSKEAKN